MRVLGVDPGTFKMGAGVVDFQAQELDLVHSTVISPRRRDSMPLRLHFLFEGLSGLIQQWHPSEMAIEEPFAGRNVRAAMAIGHAQAVAMVVAARHGLPVSSYTPRQVKKSVTDYGGSSKEQVGDMVKLLLRSDDLPDATQDETDALAVAICHINASSVQALSMTE